MRGQHDSGGQDDAAEGCIGGARGGIHLVQPAVLCGQSFFETENLRAVGADLAGHEQRRLARNEINGRGAHAFSEPRTAGGCQGAESHEA